MGDFDLAIVRDRLCACMERGSETLQHSDGEDEPAAVFEDIRLQPFIEAFRELARFFDLINIGFAFLGHNLRASCDGLEKAMYNYEPPMHLMSEALRYDFECNLREGYHSCIVWLNWPLELVVMLMDRLGSTPPDDAVYPVAKECYSLTLAKHHNFIARSMADLLLRTLPHCDGLRRRTMTHDDATARRYMHEVGVIGRQVFERVDSMVTGFETQRQEGVFD